MVEISIGSKNVEIELDRSTDGVSMASIPRLFLHVVFLSIAIPLENQIAATVISRIKDASITDESLSCEQKLVVTIAIEGGRELETENLHFDLTCVGSATCPCPCDYAAEANCECRDLNQTLIVSLTKSPVYAAYPLTYAKAFNSQPKEVVHSGLSSCDDGDFDDSPTCGWYLVGGERLADSQGFCCACTSSQVVSDTFGSLDDRTRANLNCDFFDGAWNFFSSNPASAHCLFLDPLWYQGFDVGSASIGFHIDVAISDRTDGRNATAEERLTLRPASPHVQNANKTIEAELLGDLASYTELPTLRHAPHLHGTRETGFSHCSDKMLMIPFPPGSDPATALSENQEEWMLLDKTQISLDGTECNKVGTSFTAFRFQPSGCARPVGTCLANQLHDRYTEDLDRVSKGQTPLYLIARYSGTSTVTQSPGRSGGHVALEFPVAGIRNSLVTLTAAADDLKFVLHSSPGEILHAAVCSFQNVTCGEFESLADRGYLHVQVQNTGYIPADYTVTVTNCSSGVMSAPAQKASIEAQDSFALPAFLIQMTTATQRENLTCWVALRSSLVRLPLLLASSAVWRQGEELDRQNVTFSVGQTDFEELPVNPDTQQGTGPGREPVSLSCSDYCPNIFNVFCLLLNKCWTRMLILIGILIAIFVTGYTCTHTDPSLHFLSGSCCIKGIRKGWCLKCGSWWMQTFFSNASDTSSHSLPTSMQGSYAFLGDEHRFQRKKGGYLEKGRMVGWPYRSTEDASPFAIPSSLETLHAKRQNSSHDNRVFVTIKSTRSLH